MPRRRRSTPIRIPRRRQRVRERSTQHRSIQLNRYGLQEPIMAERRVSFVAPLSFRFPAAALLLAGAALSAQPAWAGKQDDTLRMAHDQAPESGHTYLNKVRIGVLIAAHSWDKLLYSD